MKVDAQIEEECRRTISYLKWLSFPKLYCKKLSNQSAAAKYYWYNIQLKLGRCMHTLLSKIGVASIRLALDNIEGSRIGHLMNFTQRIIFIMERDWNVE